jgi:hypothetical protein
MTLEAKTEDCAALVAEVTAVKVISSTRRNLIQGCVVLSSLPLYVQARYAEAVKEHEALVLQHTNEVEHLQTAQTTDHKAAAKAQVMVATY